MRACPSPAAPPDPALAAALEALCASDPGARIGRDPLHFARRYADPGDVELAALFASALAYGRVSLFWPVLERLFARADARGGPRRWVLGFDAEDAEALAPLVYRWNRGVDLSLLALAAGRILRERGRLGAVFEAGWRPEHADLGPALEAGVLALRAAGLAEAPRLGLSAARFEDLPRGFRTFLPLPSEGSACKRWNMMLRWMVRRPGAAGTGGAPLRADGMDLGLWALPPEGLILPLDTHVSRIARYLGLTAREDGSWRTAAEITGRLRAIDPRDPTRYDFALAHLGISGACQSRHVAEICARCPLTACCVVGGRLRAPTGAD